MLIKNLKAIINPIELDKKALKKLLFVTCLCSLSPLAWAEQIDLMKLNPDQLRAIKGTINVPEKPRVADFLGGKFRLLFEDGSDLYLEPAFDGDFNFQKREEPKFNEVTKVIEETPVSILYQGKQLGSTTFFYLSTQTISGQNWWCRIFSKSESRLRKLISGCKITPK